MSNKLFQIAMECQYTPNDPVTIHEIREAFLVDETMVEFTTQLAELLETGKLKRIRDDKMQIVHD